MPLVYLAVWRSIDYIDVATPGEEIDGFDSDNEIFDDTNEPHVLVRGEERQLDTNIIPFYELLK